MGLFNFFFQRHNKIAIDFSDFKFTSGRHSRFENGKITGSIDDCWRGICVKANSAFLNSYLITTYNLDDNHTFWGNNIQMSPKQMKIENKSGKKIVFRGFGNDVMGNPFSDYGLILLVENNVVTKVILQMLDRNTELHYIK